MSSKDDMSETRESNQPLIAVFRASQYLGDTLCQQTMTRLSRTWKGKNSAAQALIARFHPLTMEEIKQARDIDAFFLQSIQGTLSRVHFVKKDGVGRLNPAPDDFHCESCQVKGWLRKEFEVSKIDGAVAPVWLCPSCAKLSAKSEEPKKAKQAESSSRPKTGLQELDENPRLMDLLSDTLGFAINEVAQTGSLIPFGILETELSERMIQGFKTGRLELGYEQARGAILAAPPDAKRYAFAWLGYITLEGVRYEAILSEGGERGEERGVAMGQRYKQRPPDVKYEPIGNPAILGPHDNLLTLSADPNAASKLRPIVTRLTVDMAHDHSPRHDEALTYEMKKCKAVILDLGDLDRPFSKELQKQPDIVHVVIGRSSWLTKFKPEDKEVILASDTLVPIKGGQLFPGFNEDGLITIGYSPPESMPSADKTRLDLVVLWMTMFKITDKG